jgi:hypothetical protein
MLLVAAAAQHARRAVLTIEEEEQLEARDESLGTMLDKLGGAIHGTSLNIMPTEVSSSTTAVAQQIAADRTRQEIGFEQASSRCLCAGVSVLSSGRRYERPESTLVLA